MIENAFKVKNGLIVDGNSRLNGYLQFNTGLTATAFAGRVYYDGVENALSYFPSTSNMDVTVNIGQENLIRVYNNSGAQINNGSAVIITGSTNGLPSIVLSNASVLGRNQVSGVASHNIPNNSEGFITNLGVVRDINLSAFSPGDELFLSDNVYGGFENSNGYDISVTSRLNFIGWVITSGATGKLLVNIQNEDITQSLTNKERNILLGNTISTGVFYFTGMTLTTPVSGTTFNVSPIKGWLVDNTSNPLNPTVTLVEYSGQTGITSPYLNTDTESYVLLTSGGTINILNSFPTPQQRRQNIYLGKLGHPNKSTFNNVFNEPDFELSPLSQVRDMFKPIRLINSGIVPSSVGASLQFKTSAGVLYGFGINYVNDILNPNSLSVPANNPATFQYRTQTGGTASNTTLIDPTLYDLNGVAVSVGGGSNTSTNQRIFILQNGQIRVQYGQTTYSSLNDAIAAISTENFTIFPNWLDNAILLGILSVKRTATDLSDINQAYFSIASKFGDVGTGGGGGISTTTLQQAYNNSTQPEIITNSTLGAVSFRRGSNSDLDNVIEVQDGSGVVTTSINASGLTTTKQIRITDVNNNSSFDRFLVVNNSGDTYYRTDVVNTSVFSSYTSTTQNEINVSTTYNTLLSPSLSMPSSVGGISAGTTVSQLSGLTFTNLFDDLLFPTVLPSYTIPTISIGGVSNSTVEVGSTITPSITVSAIKNDAGNFTQLRILRNGSPIFTNTGLTASWSSPVSDQFGFVNPNTPNSGFTINPTPYPESYVIPAPGGTSSSTTYRSDGDYNAGLIKKNNKGVNDTRGFQLRSTSAPQSGGTVTLGTQIDSSTVTYTGIYPYFYGISATLPTVATISNAISGGTATKVLSDASGTLSIPYNTSGNYIWVAYFNNYTTKTKWYVTALDNGSLDGSFLTAAVTHNINSPDGYWNNVTYKLHWSVNATSQSTLEYRNS